jgi:hypothetical protein
MTKINWDEAWSRLDPKQFEELMYWILQREGFYNVVWHGESGADKGRDIICERTELFGPRVLRRTCVVQCKKYQGRVSRQLLEEDLLKATEHSPDIFILATTGIVGSATKDWLLAQKRRLNFEIVLWERLDIELLLQRNQDLRHEYLEIDIEPEYFLDQLAYAGSRSASLRHVPLTDELRACLAAACELASRNSNLLTLGHLLAALFGSGSRPIKDLMADIGLNARKLASDLEKNWVAKQASIPMKKNGIKFSTSISSVFTTCISLINTTGENEITELNLLLSILMQDYSNSVKFLSDALKVDIAKIIEAIKSEEKGFYTEVAAVDLTGISLSRPSDSGINLQRADGALYSADDYFIELAPLSSESPDEAESEPSAPKSE